MSWLRRGKSDTSKLPRANQAVRLRHDVAYAVGYDGTGKMLTVIVSLLVILVLIMSATLTVAIRSMKAAKRRTKKQVNIRQGRTDEEIDRRLELTETKIAKLEGLVGREGSISLERMAEDDHNELRDLGRAISLLNTRIEQHAVLLHKLDQQARLEAPTAEPTQPRRTPTVSQRAFQPVPARGAETIGPLEPPAAGPPHTSANPTVSLLDAVRQISDITEDPLVRDKIERLAGSVQATTGTNRDDLQKFAGICVDLYRSEIQRSTNSAKALELKRVAGSAGVSVTIPPVGSRVTVADMQMKEISHRQILDKNLQEQVNRNIAKLGGNIASGVIVLVTEPRIIAEGRVLRQGEVVVYSG